jgi:3-hydroxybutyrate dehydrogenase
MESSKGGSMSALSGKWALVSGAAAGLGSVVAESLAGAGANIVLHDIAPPKGAAERLKSRFGVDVIAAEADLTKPSTIAAMMAELLSRCGAIDILINNAVVRHFAPVEDFPPDEWDRALAVNLSAPFHLIRLALPAMKRKGFGRIINMASIYSTRAVGDRIDYVTTKTAIVGITRTVALETARTGITCNAIAPGALPTPPILGKLASLAASAGESVEAATAKYLAERHPTGRFIAPEGIGALIVFLCSEAGRDITGTSLPVDGGWSIA